MRMERISPLSEFLRARRAMVEPEEVGVPRGRSPRRVAGLRREEVAFLAGISSDYYLKLEQGRELHPSPTVLEGLVRALALDADGASYLYRTARLPISPMAPVHDLVAESVIALIDSMPSMPVHVLNRRLDVIFANRLAQALHPGFRVGGNLVTMVFHPDVPRDDYWRRTSRRAVAYLRASLDPHDHGPQTIALLARLQAMDPAFTALWERHDAHIPMGSPANFTHPAVGEMELRYQVFDLAGSGGQSLGMYAAAPGGPSAEKLQLLSLLISETDPAAPRNMGGTRSG